MNATVHDLDGDEAGSVELPAVFETAFRPDLIGRAVEAAQANRKQAYGADEFAGLRTPAESFGSGRGLAHVPRSENVARRVPHAVSGRAAHPPKAEKDQTKKLNDKERQLAIQSAIAATTDAELVAERGHAFDEDLDLPLVVSDEFEGQRPRHVSRPRQDGVVKRVPHAVGGRRAHPPKAEKEQGKSINKQTRQLATRSALAATTDADRVADRGHEFDDDLDLPLVVDDEFEDLVKTQEVVSLLEALGVDDDIERADEGKTIRAGQGTTRGRKYQEPKSILFVTSEEPSKAARNLAGADVATAHDVNVEDLAPGTHPGRLTIYTESAIAEVADR